MIQGRASELDEVRDDAAEQHLALRRELATSAQDLARLGSALAEEGARAEMAEELHAQAQADIARLTDAVAAAEGACVTGGAFGGAAATGGNPAMHRAATECNAVQHGAPGCHRRPLHPLRRPSRALRACGSRVLQ